MQTPSKTIASTATDTVRSASSAVTATAASRAAAGPGLIRAPRTGTDRCRGRVRAAGHRPEDELHRRAGLAGSAARSGREGSAGPRSDEEQVCIGRGRDRRRRHGACSEQASDRGCAFLRPSGVANRDRPRLPAEPVQEGLREGPDDDRLAHPLPPAAEIPPFHVAVAQLVVGGAPVALVAVDEEEPVATLADVAFVPLDRLHEAAAVAGIDVGFAIESLHRRQAGRHGLDQQDFAPPVTSDPERGRPRPAGSEPQPARTRTHRARLAQRV